MYLNTLLFEQYGRLSFVFCMENSVKNQRFFTFDLGSDASNTCVMYEDYYEGNVDKFCIFWGGIDPDLL